MRACPCIALHANSCCRGFLDAALRSLGAASQQSDQRSAIGEMLLGDDDGRRSLALVDLFAGLVVLLCSNRDMGCLATHSPSAGGG
eukprot:1666425-Amphidinium_carterae.1